jgi:hypothetical protein
MKIHAGKFVKCRQADCQKAMSMLTHTLLQLFVSSEQRGRFKGGVYGRQYFHKGAKVLISQLGSGQVILPGSGRFTPRVRLPDSLESTVGRRGKDQKPKSPCQESNTDCRITSIQSCNGWTRHTFVTKLEQTATTHFFQTQFNIILTPRPRSPKRYLALRFYYLNRKCESL